MKIHINLLKNREKNEEITITANGDGDVFMDFNGFFIFGYEKK